ncbi:MEDS domain-containing protein [Candidatus Mycobacterium methanotrophicum]|uniref:MEDS domain-containing protein n=1 Tax=Candidatus Mycobacterium methanotrophicum TaxID=2943498 RepID=A0ABY4QMT9_9MYCO|nr:MEDS domain-containing protein [Candidatus Mycobacterium methanotrophicum]UQX11166.1 MEDS domain-containing protein [Candidatus Mycobacterium methanotrophicum]
MSQRNSTVEMVGQGSPHHHVAYVYSDHDHLVAELADFVEQGLSRHESVVIVATAEHRAALMAALGGGGQLDTQALVILDSADTLQKFMVGGAPDSALFAATIGGLVDAAVRGGRPVRVYGEMVAVLWDNGNVTGALALESLWNDLAAARQFFLMCAYPSASFDRGSLPAVNSVCELHSEVALLGLAHLPDQLIRSDAVASSVFVPVAASVPAARHFTLDTLTSWRLSRIGDDAALIVTELAANAVVHAKSAFRVAMSRSPSGLRLAVEDADLSRPQPRRADPKDLSGRGMALVAGLAEEWGCDVYAGGKTVWVDIPA